MITAVLIQNPSLRDAIVSLSSGIRQEHSIENVLFYQKNSLIFAFSDTISLTELFEKTIEEYQPERIFLTEIGRSIDTEHEIGDIILPNVFLHFDEKILQETITAENRDSLLGEGKFLEIFHEHKDYYVENYGLSIGGIIVDNVPNNEEISETLMTVYGADVYVENNISENYEILKNSPIPTLGLVGVVSGKIPKNQSKTPLLATTENMITTVRLLIQEENE